MYSEHDESYESKYLKVYPFVVLFLPLNTLHIPVLFKFIFLAASVIDRNTSCVSMQIIAILFLSDIFFFVSSDNFIPFLLSESNFLVLSDAFVPVKLFVLNVLIYQEVIKIEIQIGKNLLKILLL